MSQNDFNLADQGFPSMLTDMNSAFQALASNSSGATEPSLTYPLQWWYDQTASILKMRNLANSAWINMFTFNQTAGTWSVGGDLDVTGNVLVGKTAANTATVGVEARSSGLFSASRDGNTAAYFNRITTDGDIVGFLKDGALVGIIRSGGNAIQIGTTNTGLYFADNIDSIAPYDISGGSVRDNAIDLGYSGGRFKDLYLSGSALLANGSATTPSYSFSADSDSGMFRATTNTLGFATAGAERMRIDATGNLLVGTVNAAVWNNIANSADDNGHNLRKDGRAAFCYYNATNGANATVNINRTGSNGDVIRLYKSGATVGSISVTGSATSYNTSSDYRLKTDAQPMTGASARVQALNPINFEWLSDGTRVDGFLAHELSEIIPESVSGTKDAMMDEEYEVTPATGDVFTAGSEAGFTLVSEAVEASPAYYDVDGVVIKEEVLAQSAVHEEFTAVDEVIHNANVEKPETLQEGQQWRETTPAVMATRSVPDYQGIDQSKIVPLLTAALQEALERITALESA